MKNYIKNSIMFIKKTKFNSLLGLLGGLIVWLCLSKIIDNNLLSIIIGIIVGVFLMLCIQIKNLYDYADEYEKIHSRKIKIEPEDLRGISENIDNILDLDKELIEFFSKYSSGKKNDYFEKKLNEEWAIHGKEFVIRAENILSKMDNQELLYALLGTEMINQIVDVIKYFVPYEINADYLLEHPNKAKEFYIDNLIQYNAVRDLSINEYFYKRIMELNYFEEIEKFCLSCMSNDELIKLAKKSDTWGSKLYYYGFLDKNKEK